MVADKEVNGGQLSAHTLRKLDAYPSAADPSLYIKTDGAGSIVLTATVVDDFLITGCPASYLQAFKDDLFDNFEMTGGNQADWFINLSITRDHKRGLLKLDQSKYAEQVLHSFNMSDCRTASTPAPAEQVLTKSM